MKTRQKTTDLKCSLCNNFVETLLERSPKLRKLYDSYLERWKSVKEVNPKKGVCSTHRRHIFEKFNKNPTTFGDPRKPRSSKPLQATRKQSRKICLKPPVTQKRTRKKLPLAEGCALGTDGGEDDYDTSGHAEAQDGFENFDEDDNGMVETDENYNPENVSYNFAAGGSAFIDRPPFTATTQVTNNDTSQSIQVESENQSGESASTEKNAGIAGRMINMDDNINEEAGYPHVAPPNLPGSSPNLPGSSPYLPGSSTYLPGSSQEYSSFSRRAQHVNSYEIQYEEQLKELQNLLKEKDIGIKKLKAKLSRLENLQKSCSCESFKELYTKTLRNYKKLLSLHSRQKIERLSKRLKNWSGSCPGNLSNVRREFILEPSMPPAVISQAPPEFNSTSVSSFDKNPHTIDSANNLPENATCISSVSSVGPSLSDNQTPNTSSLELHLNEPLILNPHII